MYINVVRLSFFPERSAKSLLYYSLFNCNGDQFKSDSHNQLSLSGTSWAHGRLEFDWNTEYSLSVLSVSKESHMMFTEILRYCSKWHWMASSFPLDWCGNGV